MKVYCVWEHNGDDTLLYARDLPGAFSRGASLDEALEKMQGEARSYLQWRGEALPDTVESAVVQEKNSALMICDADSDVIFDVERQPLAQEEYRTLKELALRSAADFQKLYDSFMDKDTGDRPQRPTFLNRVPRTAREMYEHTKSVNSYYFGEIGTDADCKGDILSCRERGFAALEKCPGFLNMPVVEGSYGEEWSLRKVLRRFLWHDRIHARAMYRMAVRMYGKENTIDPFCFN